MAAYCVLNYAVSIDSLSRLVGISGEVLQGVEIKVLISGSGGCKGWMAGAEEVQQYDGLIQNHCVIIVIKIVGFQHLF